MVVGVMTALMAAVMALVSNDLKRVLAYSTVSQLGYMVYAVGAGGIYASQFHLFSHSIFKALLFLGAGAVIHTVGTRDMREMGGLAKKMPIVATVFSIGSLALAGLPIFNGFWSKELVLEAGLKHGPVGLYAVMVFVAGLTALYTLRCVWMVFFGKPRTELHAHEAGAAMRVALIPLAFGALTSWLLAGPFSELLSVKSLPLHGIEAHETMVILKEVFSLATLIALGVIALGILAWVFREKLAWLSKALKGIGWAADNTFGFETINRLVVKGTQATGEALRVTQTGVLNWNIFGIVLALVVVIAIVVVGA